MKDSSYFNVQGWMLNRLNLSGDKLVVFAIVHGFSQDGAGWYIGGRKYISEWLGCSEKKAGKILSDLTKEGLLKRESVRGKGWKTYRFRTVDNDESIRAKNAHISRSNMGEKRPYKNNIYINKRNRRIEKISDLVNIRCDECGGKVFRNLSLGIFQCQECGKKFV